MYSQFHPEIARDLLIRTRMKLVKGCKLRFHNLAVQLARKEISFEAIISNDGSHIINIFPLDDDYTR